MSKSGPGHSPMLTRKMAQEKEETERKLREEVDEQVAFGIGIDSNTIDSIGQQNKTNTNKNQDKVENIVNDEMTMKTEIKNKEITENENEEIGLKVQVPSELRSGAVEKVKDWLAECGSQKSKRSSSSRSSSSSSRHSTSYYVRGLPLLTERLLKQVRLIESVMDSNNSSMMNKEIENLEKVYENIQESLSNLLEYEERFENEISELTRLEDLVFSTKGKVCLWQNSCDQSCSASSKSKKSNHSNRSRQTKVCSLEQAKNGRKVGITQEENLEDPNIHRVDKVDGYGVLQATKDMVRILKAPSSEIDKFSGDPLEFEYFMASFKESVERMVPDQRGRLTRLIKYTSGEAKELIKHCVHANSKDCYDKAVKMLNAEYGCPHIIVSAYLRELEKWPAIRASDPVAFRKLYRFLLRCETYKCENRLQELDSSSTIRNIIQKLPHTFQEEWSIQAEKTKREGRYVNFNDLIQFVDFHSARLSDPTYSRGALASSDKEREKNSIKGFNSKLKLADNSAMQEVACLVCQAPHGLDDCPVFLSNSLDDKRSFVVKNNLCFKCLKATNSKHFARVCKSHLLCKICGKHHPTAFHDPGFKGIQAKEENIVELSKQDESPVEQVTDESKALRISSNSVHQRGVDGNVGLCIVPVYISHIDEPEKEVKAYAMLDNDCTSCFLSQEIMDKIAIGKCRKANISVETINGKSEKETTAINGLVVRPCELYGSHYVSSSIQLPTTYGFEGLPLNKNEVPTPANLKEWDYLSKIFPSMQKFDPNLSLGIMIGGSCPKALEPLEVIPCKDNGPYAYRTQLGWCTVGPLTNSELEWEKDIKCHNVKTLLPKKVLSQDIVTKKTAQHYYSERTIVKDNTISQALAEMYNLEFNDEYNSELGLSGEDNKFMCLMKDSVKLVEGHYELPLPFKEDTILPNNRLQAEKRFKSVQRKMQGSQAFKEEYTAFMDNLLEKGYASKSSEEIIHGKTWYLPHHGVYHPTKKKLRVVFDCGAKHQGISLNDKLLQGPDLTNSLIGVLIRFRQHPVALMADIEAMFHQVGVPAEQRSFLRFLWCKDMDTKPCSYEMNVHTFGIVSSPSCANFALRQAAIDFEDKYGEDASRTLRNNFYVDDLLKSIEDESTATSLLPRLQGMCASAGFNLTKVVSNSTNVIKSVPTHYQAESIQTLEPSAKMPIERALGVLWSVEKDAFGFRITMDNQPLTRRGVLSCISSIYDPLGLASPFLLEGRRILQEMTLEKKQWDDPISDAHIQAWSRWKEELLRLGSLFVDRCLHPKDFGAIKNVSLHTFSDASMIGYGAATYIRYENEFGKVSVALVMAKSRVAPTKATTIPRLELAAALLGCKVGTKVKSELEIDIDSQCFWVDSKIVLGYIRNETKRFKIFVANRTRQIRDLSEESEWHYVNTKDNPSDDASRGLEALQEERVDRWFNGPSFLYNSKDSWPAEENVEIPVDDPELKKEIKVNAVKIEDSESILSIITSRVSNWQRQKRVLALVLRFVSICKGTQPTTTELQEVLQAEAVLIKLIQQEYFNVKKAVPSFLTHLSPFVDKNGVLRVGGRLSNAPLDDSCKHPVILPKKGGERIIEWYHSEVHHSGRTATVNALRQNGFWLLSVNAQVRKIIYNCFRCRFLRRKLSVQLMADLPLKRTEPEPPFTHCGVDAFGPFYIQDGRKSVKRYCVIFTCFSLRAIHIETLVAMDTDSFIMALRRFLNRRGIVRSIRSDNGGNFIGTENMFSDEFKKMDNVKVKNFLMSKECEWITWEKNPPYTSHAGGVWERMIKSVRNVFDALMKEHSNRLNEEQLRTFMTEAEAIVNSRPLTVENLQDPESAPISPMQLLTLKSRVVMPPPGTFVKEDIYCRRRWKAVQYLADQFWLRWRKEYLVIQNNRQKWTKKTRNFEVGDVVLVKEANTPRNQWCTGRIVEVIVGADGLVRSARIRFPGANNVLLRSITKLVLLVGFDEQ